MPLDRNGVIQPTFVVTFQAHLQIPAGNQQQAEAAVIRAISIGMGMAPQLLGIGCAAQPMTEEVMAQLGFSRGPRT